MESGPDQAPGGRAPGPGSIGWAERPRRPAMIPPRFDPAPPAPRPWPEAAWIHSGWLLVAGLGLAALGLALPPQEGGPTTGAGLPNVPFLPTFGTADSDGRMIAVTGPDVTGGGVLYLIDTQTRQLACYQAVGGTGSQSGIRLVGARRVDLDLQLIGFNDRSKHTYSDLEKLFQANQTEVK